MGRHKVGQSGGRKDMGKDMGRLRTWGRRTWEGHGKDMGTFNLSSLRMLSTGFLLRLNIILDFRMLVFTLLHFSMILGVLFTMHMLKRTTNEVNVTGLFDPKRTVPNGETAAADKVLRF